jgi:hypothetical protein
MATVDVIANRSTASEILGKAYFETDTNSFIVYNGIGWVELQSDGTGAAPPFNQYSVDFDGSNDYIEIPATVGTWMGSLPWTISFWHYQATTGGGSLPYIYNDGVNILYRTLSSRYHAFQMTTNGTSTAHNFGTLPGTSADEWAHMVIARDATNLALYVNGVFWQNVAHNGVSATGGNAVVKIGDNGLAGAIDELAIWQETLSSSDVSNLLDTSGTNPVPVDISTVGNSGSGPDGWWRMGDNDSGSGTTVTDQGSGGNDGTLTNGPTFSTTVPS